VCGGSPVIGTQRGAVTATIVITARFVSGPQDGMIGGLAGGLDFHRLTSGNMMQVDDGSFLRECGRRCCGEGGCVELPTVEIPRVFSVVNL
jgi:hypothetical protein